MADNGISTHDPKSERAGLKLTLAAAKRATVETNGYRPYNIYDGTPSVAPVVGRPYEVDPNYNATVGGIGTTTTLKNRPKILGVGAVAATGYLIGSDDPYISGNASTASAGTVTVSIT